MKNLQLFLWGPASHVADGKQYYMSFTLNGTVYKPGDCVCLHPESSSQQPYVASIQSCWTDFASASPNNHCIELRWFDRVSCLRPGQRDVQKERELVELEETDNNPIGCISSKCTVFRTRTYEEALRLAQECSCDDDSWFFSRGWLRRHTNTIAPYAARKLSAAPVPQSPQEGKRGTRRTMSLALPASHQEDVADSEESRAGKRLKADSRSLTAFQSAEAAADIPVESDTALETAPRRTLSCGRGKKPATAQPTVHTQPVSPGNIVRTCVECGATQTPQWREGPHGPKTLCNACGVRYGRQLNRAGKRCGVSASAGRAAQHKASTHSNDAAQATLPSPKAPTAHQHVVTPIVRQTSAKLERSATDGSANRPIRQAAMMSANRTAEFARSGRFPEGEQAAAMASSCPNSPVGAKVVQRMYSADYTMPASFAGSSAAGLPNNFQAGWTHLDPLAQFASSIPMIKPEATSTYASELAANEQLHVNISRESSRNSNESAQEAVGMTVVAASSAHDQELEQVQLVNKLDHMAVTTPLNSTHVTSPVVSQQAYIDQLNARQLDERRLCQDAATDSALLSNVKEPAYVHQMQEGGQATAEAWIGSNDLMSQALSMSTTHDAIASLGISPSMLDHAAASSVSGQMASKQPWIDLAAVARRASIWVPSISRYVGVLSCIEGLHEQLPPQMADGLAVLGAAVDKAASEAAAADAALHAVQQVLIARQEAAARARGDAVKAVGRLGAVVADLVDRNPQIAVQTGMQASFDSLPAIDSLDDNVHCMEFAIPSSCEMDTDTADCLASAALPVPDEYDVVLGSECGVYDLNTTATEFEKLMTVGGDSCHTWCM